MKRTSILLLGMLVFATLAQSQAPFPKPEPDLRAAIQAVNSIRQSVYSDAKQQETLTGKATPRAQLEAVVGERAKGVLSGVDIHAIPAKDAADWAQLFSMAGMADQAKELQLSALTYHNVQLMFTMVDLIPKLLAKGELDQAFTMIKHVPDLDASMVGMVGESVGNALHANGIDKSRPEFALKCLKTLRSRVDLDPSPLGGRGNSMADYVYVDLSMKMLELRYGQHPDPALLNEMKALKARFASSKSTNAFGQSPSHRVDEFFDRIAAIGTPAPDLVADRTIGDFAGLKSLRGKVVVLDFMAHWCGPCKAALPGLQTLQKEFGPSGLQVVSVTSFYGYYDVQKGLKPDAEYDLMKGFVKSYGMAWPVVFDAKQVSHSRYHVGAIPHVVVLDRKGIVRRVQVGNTPEETAITGATVRKLLGETN